MSALVYVIFALLLVIAGFVLTVWALDHVRSRLWWAASRRRKPVVMIQLVPRSVGLPTKWRRENPSEHWN